MPCSVVNRIGCLVCPEGKRKSARTRGLCDKHYQEALKKVREGLTTWARLAAAGKARLSDVELGKSRNDRFGLFRASMLRGRG